MADQPIDQFGIVDAHGSPSPKNEPVLGYTMPNDNDLSMYGAPIDPLNSKIPAKDRAGIIYRDIPITTVNSEWDFPRLRNALNLHAQGQFAESGRLCDAMLGDDRIQAAMGSRIGALFGLPISFSPADDSALAKEIEDAWKKAYPKLCTRSALAESKRWAIMMGFSVSEVLWDTTVTPWQPYLKIWHPQNLYFDWYTRSFWAITLDGLAKVTPGDGRWFVHAPHGTYRGWMYGAVRALALPWLLRNMAFRDWARYNEVHGMPIIIAETPSTGEESVKDAFIQSLANLGSETTVHCPQNVDGTKYNVRFLEAVDRAFEAFKALIDKSDTAIVLTIQWQNLTTEVKEGSFAAAREHGDVKQTCLEMDEATLADDVREQLARVFADFNFGDRDLSPSTHYDTEPNEDKKTRIECLQSFSLAVQQLRTAGVSFDMQKLAKAYDVRLTLDKEETDQKGSGQIFAYHLQYGVTTKNEVRASIGLPAIDGGDEFTTAPTVDAAAIKSGDKAADPNAQPIKETP